MKMAVGASRRRGSFGNMKNLHFQAKRGMIKGPIKANQQQQLNESE